MIWTHCCVTNCGRPSVDEHIPYCDLCVPVAGFVTAEQLASAKSLLRKGASLHQAAVRVRADPRDLDTALWLKLGERGREAPMF